MNKIHFQRSSASPLHPHADLLPYVWIEAPLFRRIPPSSLCFICVLFAFSIEADTTEATRWKYHFINRTHARHTHTHIHTDPVLINMCVRVCEWKKYVMNIQRAIYSHRHVRSSLRTRFIRDSRKFQKNSLPAFRFVFEHRIRTILYQWRFVRVCMCAYTCICMSTIFR